MKKLLVLIIIASFVNCKPTPRNMEEFTNFYVGTYTNGDSRGIYEYKLDHLGKLTKIGLVAETNNPSFLAKTRDGKTLLAVDETNKNGMGFIKSFRIEKDTLTFKSKSNSGGAHPCFITVNDNNQVLVANYTGGNVGYLNLYNESNLTKLLDVQQHKGRGITDRQKSAHAHSTWFNPTKNEIISLDLGTNELWFSKIDSKENKLILSSPCKLKMAAGAGPRHLTFHPNNKWFYVLNELNNTICLVKEINDFYAVTNTISMLPEKFSEFSKGADLHISDDGKFLYASNRGHESIVIYKVNKDNGSLNLVGFEPVKGKNPRNFSLSPNNKFLLVANQDTNNIVSFLRDEVTGKLTFISEVSAPNPVCILF